MSYTLMAVLINILFVLIIVAGFFVGFWRGLKKSAVNVAFAVVGIIVAFFVTGPVTNAILGIKISGGTSLRDYIVNMVTSSADVQNLIAKVPSLKTLIQGLPAALLNTVVFMLLTGIFEGILYIIYKIIAVIFLKNKVEGDEEPPKKRRVWGGVVGAAKTFVLMIFAMMPLCALSGMFSTLTSQNSYISPSQEVAAYTEEVSLSQEDQNIITQNVPKVALDAFKAINNSGFAVFGGIFGLDNATFDYLAGVNVDGHNVSIRREVVAFWPAYQLYQDVSTVMAEDSGYTFADLNFNKVEKTVNNILGSGLYNTVVVDLVKDVAQNPQDYDFIPDGIVTDILTEFSAKVEADIAANQDKEFGDYLTSDIKTVVKAIKNLASHDTLSQIIEKFNAYNNEADEEQKQTKLTEFLQTLTNEENFNTIKQTLSDLFSMNMIKAGAKPLAQMLSDMMLGQGNELAPNLPDLGDASWSTIAGDLADILQSASNVLGSVDLQQLTGQMETVIEKFLDKDAGLDLDHLFAHLGTLLDKLDASPLFQMAEGSIVDSLLGENLAFPEQYLDVNGEPETIDSYSKLFTQVLLPSMKSLRESELYTKIKESYIDKVFNDLATSLKQDKLFLKKIILPLVQIKPTDTMIAENMKNDFVNFEVLGTDYQKWSRDLDYIADLLIELQNTTVGQEQNGIDALFTNFPQYTDFLIALKTEGRQKISDIFTPLLKAQSTQDIAQDFFDKVAEAINTLTGAEPEISITTSYQFFEGDGDQTEDVVDVLTAFLPILEVYEQSRGELTLEELVKPTEMGGKNMSSEVNALLEAMQANADKGGIFADAAQKLQEKISSIAVSR